MPSASSPFVASTFNCPYCRAPILQKHVQPDGFHRSRDGRDPGPFRGGSVRASFFSSRKRMVLTRGLPRQTTMADSDSSCCPLGLIRLQASRADFKPMSQPDIHVHVTETLRLELHLELATRVEQTQVSSDPMMVQLDTSALGRAVNKETVSSLPLVTRNFTQITGLSPGVAVGVYNAGELGTGGTALSQIGKSNDGIFVHGATIL